MHANSIKDEGKETRAKEKNLNMPLFPLSFLPSFNRHTLGVHTYLCALIWS